MPDPILAAPGCRQGRLDGGLPFLAYAPLEDRPRDPAVLVLTAFRVDSHLNAGWLVGHHHAGIRLVAVLAARAAPAGRAHIDFGILQPKFRRGNVFECGDRCGRGVDTSVPLSGRDALPAVSAGFAEEGANEGFLAACSRVRSRASTPPSPGRISIWMFMVVSFLERSLGPENPFEPSAVNRIMQPLFACEQVLKFSHRLGILYSFPRQ